MNEELLKVWVDIAAAIFDSSTETTFGENSGVDVFSTDLVLHCLA